MKENKIAKTIFFSLMSIVLIISAIGTVSYAWFTNNSKVETNTATAKSGVSSMSLLIGPDEANLVDSSTQSVDIPQVNEMSAEMLYPVSTADLETFLYASAFTEGKASGFAQDSNESRFWHGKIYLKMEGNEGNTESKYKLYLDSSENSGGKIGQSSEGHLLNGSRLGLKFEGQDPVILKFEEESKGTTENNTMINGVVIENGNVLDSNANPVSDPAIEFSEVSLDSSLENIEFPTREIAILTANQTLAVDVYFYIEGCDEDSVGELAKNEAEFHLAFYAVAE